MGKMPVRAIGPSRAGLKMAAPQIRREREVKNEGGEKDAAISLGETRCDSCANQKQVRGEQIRQQRRTVQSYDAFD